LTCYKSIAILKNILSKNNSPHPNKGDQQAMNDQSKQTASSQNTYVFDPESAEELGRLIMMDQVTTRAMGGPLAGLPALPKNANVIDLACGPGGWVIDVAYARPDVQVCGVDISRRMVDYANARACSQKRLNASFGVMDITQPLDFADNSFDLVNARFVTSVLPTESWPTFLQECKRITRPGGIFRLTETEHMGLTNSPACEKIRVLACQLMRAKGHGFSPDGESFGITPVAGRLVQNAGFQQVQQNVCMVNFSAGTEAWAEFFHNMEIASTLGARMAQQINMPTKEQIDSYALIQQALMEMQRNDFCGIWWFLSTWGIKPEA
jgi:ubiquinone/menaquinone biosynthesis C-methylase UbiE